MDGYIVYFLLGMFFNDVEEIIWGQVFDVIVDVFQGLVNGYGFNGNGGSIYDGGMNYV